MIGLVHDISINIIYPYSVLIVSLKKTGYTWVYGTNFQNNFESVCSRSVTGNRHLLTPYSYARIIHSFNNQHIYRYIYLSISTSIVIWFWFSISLFSYIDNTLYIWITKELYSYFIIYCDIPLVREENLEHTVNIRWERIANTQDWKYIYVLLYEGRIIIFAFLE